MNDGCARAEDAGSKAFPTHLVGVGPDEEFATAKQLTSGPVTWLGNVENLEAFLDRPPLAHPCVSNGVQKGPPIGVEEGPPFQII